MKWSGTQVSSRHLGFTLIEVAIVVLVVSILLGYTLALFPVQQDLKKSQEVSRELDQIIEQLVAFAQVNGRLPCPDTNAGTVDGFEDLSGTPTDPCDAYFGFIPAHTLGMNGRFNENGVLIDPWGEGYGYAVSLADAGDGNPDFVSANGIRIETMANARGDLFVCDDSAVLGDYVDCAAAGSNDVVRNVAAVVISVGKDRNLGTILADNSAIQIENIDDFDDGTNDKVYVFSTRSDSTGSEFDDVIRWLSTNQLFSKMIQAGQLP